MYCQLQSMICELERKFAVQNYGIISGPIYAIEKIRPESLGQLKEHVLYIASQADLYMLSEKKELCKYPLLCIVKEFDGRFTQLLLSMRSVILVRHEDAVEVLTELSEIMYRLGRQHNSMPDYYWLLMAAADLDDLLYKATEQMQMPMLVTDPTYKLIAHSGKNATGLVFHQLGELGCTLPNLQEVFRPARRISQTKQYALTFSYYKMAEQFYLLEIPLLLHQELKGHLILVTHDNMISEDLTQNCATLVHFIIPYLRSFKQLLPQYSTTERFLTMLLDQQIADETEISKWLEYYSWKPKTHLYVMVFSSFGDPIERSPQDILLELSDRLGAKGLVYYSSIVLIYESNREMTCLQLRLVLEPVLAIMERYNLCCGISAQTQPLAECYKAYFLARKALDLGRIFDQNERICFYEKYAVYHILEVVSRDLDLKSMLTSGLRQLVREGSQELLRTLEMYMKCGCSMAQCAKAMFLHTNTVKYRMNQISDMLQCDLKDGDTFCQIYMSLKILEFSEKTKFESL